MQRHVTRFLLALVAALWLPSAVAAATFKVDFAGTVGTLGLGVTGVSLGDALSVSISVDPSLASQPPAGDNNWVYFNATALLSGSVGGTTLPGLSAPAQIRIRDAVGAGLTDSLRIDFSFDFATTALFGVPVTTAGMTMVFGNAFTATQGNLWNDVALTPAKFTQALLDASTTKSFIIVGADGRAAFDLARGTLTSVAVAPVPLPGALGLLLAGLGGLFGALRLRRARHRPAIVAGPSRPS